MSAFLHSVTHGLRGFELSYALMLTTMLISMISERAPWKKYWEWPFTALCLTIFAYVIIFLTLSVLPGSGNSDLNVLQLAFAVLVFVMLGLTGGKVLAEGRPSAPHAHRRGAIVSFARRISNRRGTGITLAGIPIAPGDETKHFKLIGTTGTGKSTAIREILGAALARGDRAIIADPDGGYLARFYDAARGDVILNPFDGDAHKWDLFGEITNDYDVEQLARSLIPDSGDPDRIWGEYARTFFSAVVHQTIAAGARYDAELYRLVTSATVEEFRVLLAGTAAGPFLEPGNEKMFGSVRSITTSAVSALKYTTRQQAAPFSVRQWVKEGAARGVGGEGGALFLPYKAGEIAAQAR